MCHGHPKQHRCAHTSMTWYYCPSAYIDMETGVVSPCGNNQIAPSQSSKAACPLQHCNFDNKGGSWMCCQCRQGPNTRGWCAQRLSPQKVGIHHPVAAGELQMTCDHGCCESCIRYDTGRAGAECEAAWPNSMHSYVDTGSPSSSSDGGSTWITSPGSSKASSVSGSDRGSNKSSSHSKKRTSKKHTSNKSAVAKH